MVPDGHQHGTGGTSYEYIIISSFSLQFISLLYPGKHLVWRVLCDWLCPHVDCALVPIQMWSTLTKVQPIFTNFKGKAASHEFSLVSPHIFYWCTDCYLSAVKVRTFREWRRMVLED